jgi:hypothetical protein
MRVRKANLRTTKGMEERESIPVIEVLRTRDDCAEFVCP